MPEGLRFHPGIIRVVTAGDLRVAVVESEVCGRGPCTHDDGPLGKGLEGGGCAVRATGRS